MTSTRRRVESKIPDYHGNPFHWTVHKARHHVLVRKSDVGPTAEVVFMSATSASAFLIALRVKQNNEQAKTAKQIRRERQKLRDGRKKGL